MNMAYIRRYYGVPAKRGMRVTMDGRTAVIVGAAYAYLRIRFDDTGKVDVAHPTWRVQYGDQEDSRMSSEGRDRMRELAYAVAQGDEDAVELVAHALHQFEGHGEDLPCAQCYVRAGVAVKALIGRTTNVGRGFCPVCENKKSFSLTKDGMLHPHRGTQRDGAGFRLPCEGTGKKPVRALPKSMGMGKDGPADLSEREGISDGGA